MQCHTAARTCVAPNTARPLSAAGRRGSRPSRWRPTDVTRASAVDRAAQAPGPAVAAAQARQQPAAAQLLALKEWAPLVAAIATGEQTVLLRKGGIKEPTFQPAARRFMLFPTSFHTDAQLLKPGVAERFAAEVRFDPKAQAQLSFGVAAEVTGAWTTRDPAVLAALEGLHVCAPAFLESRLRWREQQPITVLEVRAHRLTDPLILPAREDWWGCFSWVDLGGPELLASVPPLLESVGAPALQDLEFAVAQRLCRQQLAGLADVQELSLP